MSFIKNLFDKAKSFHPSEKIGHGANCKVTGNGKCVSISGKGNVIAVGNGEVCYNGKLIQNTAPRLDEDRMIEDTFNSLDIDVSSLDVEIFPSELEHASVRFRGNAPIFPLGITVPSGYLRIRMLPTACARNNVYGTVIVELPKKEYDAIAVSVGSADVSIKRVSPVSKINILTSSGDASVEKTSANAIDIRTVSGDIDLDEVSFNSAELKATSGDISVVFASQLCSSLQASTKSGDIDVHVTDVGDIDVQMGTVSGSTYNCARSMEAPGNKNKAVLSLSAVSGDIALE